MILKDRDLLNEDGSIPIELICRCIQEHEDQAPRLNKLNKYVDGDHDILHRKMPDNTSNVKLVANHAEYITSIATGYVHGAAVSYTGPGTDDIITLFTRCHPADYLNPLLSDYLKPILPSDKLPLTIRDTYSANYQSHTQTC